MKKHEIVAKIILMKQDETIRWDEHSDIGKNSEPVKHLYRFPEQRLNWKILRGVPN